MSGGALVSRVTSRNSARHDLRRPTDVGREIAHDLLLRSVTHAGSLIDIAGRGIVVTKQEPAELDTAKDAT